MSSFLLTLSTYLNLRFFIYIEKRDYEEPHSLVEARSLYVIAQEAALKRFASAMRGTTSCFSISLQSSYCFRFLGTKIRNKSLIISRDIKRALNSPFHQLNGKVMIVNISFRITTRFRAQNTSCSFTRLINIYSRQQVSSRFCSRYMRDLKMVTDRCQLYCPSFATDK